MAQEKTHARADIHTQPWEREAWEREVAHLEHAARNIASGNTLSVHPKPDETPESLAERAKAVIDESLARLAYARRRLQEAQEPPAMLQAVKADYETLRKGISRVVDIEDERDFDDEGLVYAVQQLHTDSAAAYERGRLAGRAEVQPVTLAQVMTVVRHTTSYYPSKDWHTQVERDLSPLYALPPATTAAGETATCGAYYGCMNGVRCELPLGHGANHRGSYANAVVQWPEPSR